MGMEAFAEAARLLVPDWHVVAVEDVDFLAPLKFYRDEPRTLTIRALAPRRRDGTTWSPTASLEARADAAGRGRAAADACTSPARSGSARQPPGRRSTATPSPSRGRTRCSATDDVYRAVLPRAGLPGRLRPAWRDNGGAVGAARRDLPADHEPPDGADASLGRGWWSCASRPPGCGRPGTTGGMALPPHVDRSCRCGPAPQARASCYAVGHPRGRRRLRLPRSSTPTATSSCGWTATARSSCPARLPTPTSLRADPRRDAASAEVGR